MLTYKKTAAIFLSLALGSVQAQSTFDCKEMRFKEINSSMGTVDIMRANHFNENLRLYASNCRCDPSISLEELHSSMSLGEMTMTKIRNRKQLDRCR